jgi:predicted nucleotide-binding protein (sugar kinase/HSP70/actin superfamily)
VLELDAQTADAGIDTRLEAFLDIISGFREVVPSRPPEPPFAPARLDLRKGRSLVETGDGRRVPLTDPAVRVLLPSMGEATSQGVAAAFRYAGIDAVAAPPPGREELALGKSMATCKECLPFLLTAGTLRRYLREERRPEEILVYLMAGSDGPCRLGQYQVTLREYLVKNRIGNVALLTPTCEDSYAGLPATFTRRAWQAICLGDGLEDIRAAILDLATDPDAALAVFEQGKTRIVQSLATDSRSRMLDLLAEEMSKLAGFNRKVPLREAVRVNLVGEIYARRDEFSRQGLVEKLAARGIVVKTAPVWEWLHYSDYCVTHGLTAGAGVLDKLAVGVKQSVKHRDERAIQQRLVQSGFFEADLPEMSRIMTRSRPLLNPVLATEASLTIGSTLLALSEAVHGVISIGPFGCMPCRIAEAVLNCRLPAETAALPWKRSSSRLPGMESALPFLAIETDGNPFPQLVEARLDSFVLAARRLRDELAQGARLQTDRGGGAAGRMNLKYFPGKCPSRS